MRGHERGSLVCTCGWSTPVCTCDSIVFPCDGRCEAFTYSRTPSFRNAHHGMCMQFAMCICTHSTRNLQMRVRRARAWNHIVPCMDRSEAAWSALALRSCMHVYLHIDRSRSDACARVACLFSALRTARTNRTSRVMHECAQAVGCRCRA